MKRFLKQFFYGLFYLVLWAGIFYGVYIFFVRPAPSCFDSIQNQNETGIDCGGVCGTECIPTDLHPLTVSSAPTILSIPGTSSVSIVAQIENSNALYAAAHFAYRFTLYDANDLTVGSQDGTSFIYGSEIKMLAIPNTFFSQGVPVRAELTVSNPQWVKVSDFSKPDVVIQSQSTLLINNAIQTSGSVSNHDALLIPRAEVVAVYIGLDGLTKGVSHTELHNLSPGETRAFTILHPMLPGLNVATTKLFVYSSRP